MGSGEKIMTFPEFDSVLIFGGSQGIGKIITAELSLKKYNITVVSRNIKHLEDFKNEPGINTKNLNYEN